MKNFVKVRRWSSSKRRTVFNWLLTLLRPPIFFVSTNINLFVLLHLNIYSTALVQNGLLCLLASIVICAKKQCYLSSCIYKRWKTSFEHPWTQTVRNCDRRSCTLNYLLCFVKHNTNATLAFIEVAQKKANLTVTKFPLPIYLWVNGTVSRVTALLKRTKNYQLLSFPRLLDGKVE